LGAVCRLFFFSATPRWDVASITSLFFRYFLSFFHRTFEISLAIEKPTPREPATASSSRMASGAFRKIYSARQDIIFDLKFPQKFILRL
jgi:hypothetical protein